MRANYAMIWTQLDLKLVDFLLQVEPEDRVEMKHTIEAALTQLDTTAGSSPSVISY